MSDSRDNLRPYVNTRVPIRGTFDKFDDHWIEHNKQVGRVCITFPESTTRSCASTFGFSTSPIGRSIKTLLTHR